MAQGARWRWKAVLLSQARRALTDPAIYDEQRTKRANNKSCDLLSVLNTGMSSRKAQT